MQEQCHQGKSADNPHSHSSSGLRDVETSALKQGNQRPCNATNQEGATQANGIKDCSSD